MRKTVAFIHKFQSKLKWFSILFLISLTILAFQNCGNINVSKETFQSLVADACVPNIYMVGTSRPTEQEVQFFLLENSSSISNAYAGPVEWNIDGEITSWRKPRIPLPNPPDCTKPMTAVVKFKDNCGTSVEQRTQFLDPLLCPKDPPAPIPPVEGPTPPAAPAAPVCPPAPAPSGVVNAAPFEIFTGWPIPGDKPGCSSSPPTAPFAPCYCLAGSNCRMWFRNPGEIISIKLDKKIAYLGHVNLSGTEGKTPDTVEYSVSTAPGDTSCAKSRAVTGLSAPANSCYSIAGGAAGQMLFHLNSDFAMGSNPWGDNMWECNIEDGRDWYLNLRLVDAAGNDSCNMTPEMAQQLISQGALPYCGIVIYFQKWQF